MSDIIIPVWNQAEATRDCLEHIISNTEYPYRLIIIDNGSGDETKNYLESFKKEHSDKVLLIRNEQNDGFVKAVNQGMRSSNADYICIMNNDTLPAKRWLSELVSFAESHEKVGLLNPLSSGHIPRKISVNEYAQDVAKNKDVYMEMNQCQGFCMLVKRAVVDKIGYMDERFGVGGFDDTDYSMRAHKAGYRSVCVHSSYVFHKEHQSFNAMGDRKKIQSQYEKEYFKKWPRHLRIPMILSISDNTLDSEIARFLELGLYLARQWCWINMWFFSRKNPAARIESVKRELKFPLHQNIKVNFLNENIKFAEIIVRVLERSIGSKRRKKYDLLICRNGVLADFLRFPCRFQGCRVLPMVYDSQSQDKAKTVIDSIRKGISDE